MISLRGSCKAFSSQARSPLNKRASDTSTRIDFCSGSMSIGAQPNTNNRFLFENRLKLCDGLSIF